MTNLRFPTRAARAALAAAVLAAAAGAGALACNDANEPLQIDAYGYKGVVPDGHGGQDSVAFHWRQTDLPVGVWVENQANLPAYTQSALQRWADAIGAGHFRGQIVADSGAARIIVHFAQPPVAEPAVHRLGSAMVQPCLGAADVIVDSARTIEVPIDVYVFTGTDPTTPENRACLEATTAHELGHALGLFQHSPNPEDVMYRLPTVATPSVHDRATAFYLYKAPTQLVPAPRP